MCVPQDLVCRPDPAATTVQYRLRSLTKGVGFPSTVRLKERITLTVKSRTPKPRGQESDPGALIRGKPPARKKP